MCGISGLLSSSEIAVSDLVAMNSLIRHRGPDDEGYALFSQKAAICLAGKDTAQEVMGASIPWAPKRQISGITTDAKLAFGHRRLSIVDLSLLGHQPMSYGDGRYWITYNGEVYNHLELRAELEAAGYRFISHSDTEVILAAYDRWGEQCLSRFNGMWAFAIFDSLKNTLFFARDRFGVKPFYYWLSSNGLLAFGSEIKQFTALPGWQAKLNGQRAYDFLVWAITDHTDETLFSGVYQLCPGHYAILDLASWRERDLVGGRIRTKSWYQLTPRNFTGSFDEASREFRRLFTEAIELRLRADVSVGSCLSGGLDSSSIVSVINELLRKKSAHSQQKTFSACSDIEKFDERYWIDKVVNATGVDAHYVYPALESLFAESANITWHQDEPYGSTSIYAQWNVFRLAAENAVKVVLDGQGADEQLAGYPKFFGPRFASLFVGGDWVTLLREIHLTKQLHGQSYLRSFQRIADILLPNFAREIARSRTGLPTIHPSWIELNKLGAHPIDPLAQDGRKAGSIYALSKSMMGYSSLPMLLHWEDRNSMAHSIESRVPLLDYRLVEFILGLPDEYKLANGVTKRVLRSGMSGVIPDIIRDRMDKLGFVTPEEVWVREKAPDLFREKLASAIRNSQGLLKSEANEVLEMMIAGERDYNFGVWRMINFGEWVEQFSVKC